MCNTHTTTQGTEGGRLFSKNVTFVGVLQAVEKVEKSSPSVVFEKKRALPTFIMISYIKRELCLLS